MKKKNKPKAEQETAQPTAAWFNYQLRTFVWLSLLRIFVGYCEGNVFKNEHTDSSQGLNLSCFQGGYIHGSKRWHTTPLNIPSWNGVKIIMFNV